MLKLPKSAALLLLSLASLHLAACRAQSDTDAKVPANVQAFALTIPKVENSPKSPCWQQKQIAKQQAFIRSTSEGKEVVRPVTCGRKPKGKKTKSKAVS